VTTRSKAVKDVATGRWGAHLESDYSLDGWNRSLIGKKHVQGCARPLKPQQLPAPKSTDKDGREQDPSPRPNVYDVTISENPFFASFCASFKRAL